MTSLPISIKTVEGEVFDFLDTLPTPDEIFNAVSGIFSKIVEAVNSIDLSGVFSIFDKVGNGLRDIGQAVGLVGDDDEGGEMVAGRRGNADQVASQFAVSGLSPDTVLALNELGVTIVNNILTGMTGELALPSIMAAGILFANTFKTAVTSAFQIFGFVSLVSSMWGLAIVNGLIQAIMLNIPRIQAVMMSVVLTMQVLLSTSQYVTMLMGMQWTTLATQVAIANITFGTVMGQMKFAVDDFARAVNYAALMIGALLSAINALNNASVNIPNVTGGGGGAAPKPKPRAHGGPTLAGHWYETNEGGIAEVFRTNTGRTFFMPGQHGQIEPLAPVQEAKGKGGQSPMVVDNSQHYEINMNGDFGSYTKDELKGLFKQAVEEANKSNKPSALRSIYLSGRT